MVRPYLHDLRECVAAAARLDRRKVSANCYSEKPPNDPSKQSGDASANGLMPSHHTNATTKSEIADMLQFK
jgi:hypothetical protein